MNDHDDDLEPSTERGTGAGTGGGDRPAFDLDTREDSQVTTEGGPGARGEGDDLPSTNGAPRSDSLPPTECDSPGNPSAAHLEARGVGGEPAAGRVVENERLLDLLERWEERYRRDEDASADSLGVDDPALLEALRDRIHRQKRLYGFLKHAPDATAGRGAAEEREEVAVDPAPAREPPVRAGGDRGAAALALAPADPQSIGRYRVTRVLGQGGFGRVYLAHDADLDRDVAIKVPIPGRAVEFVDVGIYLREARILARLSHPCIVPVYDVGRTEDGRYFVVSKYMDGGDLAARLRRGRPAFAESSRLVADLAEALHYTHVHDLFHRDIKPANILLDADGRPSLADFGLALKDEDLGRGSGYIGTVAYMSPEQARGEGHRVDGRSDIFSLGIVLFELLTGRRPFRGGTHPEVLHQIIHAEPRPPRQIDDTIPAELERIGLKALSKRAPERYSTARDLAEDLRRFLQTAPWAAPTGDRPPGPSARAPGSTPGLGLTTTPTSEPADSGGAALKIVPKGLGSFDEHDANFYLELLPGPRDRDGLPDGVRFWKSRIEATDPDKTFRVGLIYGPSGCGKSSLVKAGLLPRLAPHVSSIYIEATGAETESRGLRGLRKFFPELPDDAGLAGALTILRRGHGLPPGRKVLLVIDQFEQWLFARQEEAGTELVAALRQCDGEHVQALCLLRDDFWMAATRFMRDLEIDLVPDRNIAAVDLFDPRHARKVLAAYGRAFEVLPPRGGDLAREQNAFLDQAVAGLAQDNRVAPVRLAMFAEMIKGKPWVPATLRAVGGMEGVGVKFLEETFGSARSNPKHRYHQKAAQAVLGALLPEVNADIKGRMRSVADLSDDSGYAGRPGEFAELIRILDAELRLITPVDLESSTDDEEPSHPAGGRYYQLTHDYLVHALREWLTRKQRETRRGRAELLLAERSALWNARPEDRYLPSAREWTTIRLLTRPRGWSESQRRMMRRASRALARRGAAVALLSAGLMAVALTIRHRIVETSHAQQADRLVQQLLTAETARVPGIVREMADYRRWTEPRLRRIVRDELDGSQSKLHASLALLPVDADQVNYLVRCLRDADPTRMEVIRDALAPSRGRLSDGLWNALREAKPGTPGILPLASVLARYDPANPEWAPLGDKVADAMVLARLHDVRGWREALFGIRAALTNRLAAIFRETAPDHVHHELATELLADYAADRPALLLDLMLDADPKAFSMFFGVIEQDPSAILADLRDAKDGNPLGRGNRGPGTGAARRARAAVALIRLGHPDETWPLLGHSPDPEIRSALINALYPHRVEPELLVRELERFGTVAASGPAQAGPVGAKKDLLFDPIVSGRRALIQALAGYPEDALPPREREALVRMLAALYRDDSDPGVHSAAELTLRRWGHQDRLKLEPGKPPAAGAPNRPRWSINPEGQTMVLVDGPVEFDMGSPESDTDRDESEVLHRRILPHRFSIAATEVSVASFQRYAQERFGSPHKYNQKFSPDRAGPMIGVSWYESVAYCNWLSDKEGLPHCYEPNPKGEFAEGMRVNARAVAAGGYRLPTGSEWEYACRAGTATIRYFGNTPELLGAYEWYVATSEYRARPCGMLLPNDLGLFDMLGNAWEWCHDRRDKGRIEHGLEDIPIKPGSTVVEQILDEDVSGAIRLIRGSTFHRAPIGLRSAARSWFDPWGRRDDLGFRVARTVP